MSDKKGSNKFPNKYDALIVVSFGGPEGPDQVDDFLNRVTHGKNISTERLEKVKQTYLSFGGISPANENNQELIKQLRVECDNAGLENMPIYLGNRNSPPFIKDTLLEMKDYKNALAFITSPFSSYSSCRKYLEDIETAKQSLADEGISTPEIHPIRHFYNHPLFIKIHADAICKAIHGAPPYILFSAHSLPLVMAENCEYTAQLLKACKLIMKEVIQEIKDADSYNWDLVYQSISGDPKNWLSPDIKTVVTNIKESDSVVVVPIGFLSSHMEVIFDLDTDLKNHAESLGMEFTRTKTPQEDPRFASLVLELITERTENAERRFLTSDTPPDYCPPDCCIDQKVDATK